MIWKRLKTIKQFLISKNAKKGDFTVLSHLANIVNQVWVLWFFIWSWCGSDVKKAKKSPFLYFHKSKYSGFQSGPGPMWSRCEKKWIFFLHFHKWNNGFLSFKVGLTALRHVMNVCACMLVWKSVFASLGLLEREVCALGGMTRH